MSAIIKVPELDRGYAWVVAVACFIINFIMAGIARAAGILYLALIDTYGVSREVATSPFSTRFCVRNLSGPVVGLLGQHFGIRAVTTTGGILAGIGGALCFFAPDIFWITIFWGVIHGFGYGLCSIIHIQILNEYFDKYKGLALGFALSGDCFGTSVLPSILEYLLLHYDAKGTFLILGGIALNVVPATLLLKSPPWVSNTRNEVKKQKDSESNVTMNSYSINGIDNKAFTSNSLTRFNYIQDGSNKNVFLKCYMPVDNTVKENPTVSISSNMHMFRDSCGCISSADELKIKNNLKDEENCKISTDNFLCDPKQRNCFAIHENFIPEFHVKNQDETNSDYINIKKIELSTNGQSLLSSDLHIGDKETRFNKNSETISNLTTTNDETDNEILKENVAFMKSEGIDKIISGSTTRKVFQTSSSESTNRPGVMGQFLKTNIKPIFLLISATLALYLFLLIAVLTIIIDYGLDKGLSPEFGKYLVIGFSVGDLIGLFGFGVVIDKKWISMSYYAGLITSLMGFFITVIPFSSNFYFILFCMSACGFIQGGEAVMYPVLVVQYMEKSEEAVALGSLNFYSGLLMLALPAMIGFFRDTIGSYDGVFWTVGGLCILSGAAWILEPCILRLQERMLNQKC